MANGDIRNLLSFACLTAPINPNPADDLERYVNKMRMKYRTYLIEFNVDHGVVMLPYMFGDDFGDQIGRYATLVDRNMNRFEVLVERMHGGIYLTKGWHALRDFYRLRLGGWVTMIFVGDGRFNIRIMDRFGKKRRCPNFNPPIEFRIERNYVPPSLLLAVPLPFAHDLCNFRYNYKKRLTAGEILDGAMTLAATGFCELTLDVAMHALRIVDDCGNIWECTLAFDDQPYAQFKIGGNIKQMILGRRLCEGSHVMFGAPVVGGNDTVYFKVIKR